MTKHTNNGISPRDEILSRVLRHIDADMKAQDYDALLKKFSLSGPDIQAIDALYRPFKDLQGKFGMAVWELAEANRADNCTVPQSHPAYMSRLQRLAVARLAALVTFRALKDSWTAMAPVLQAAQQAVKAGAFPENIDSALMLVKLQAAELLSSAVKTFVNLKWKNILEGESEENINWKLSAIHYAYRQSAKNSPALFRSDAHADLFSVNLADFAGEFQSKSGHFLVRRKILNAPDHPYGGIDWALTASPRDDEKVYRGNDFVVTNGTLYLDVHEGVGGFERNEQIAQLPNGPLDSMSYGEWKQSQAPSAA